MMSKILHCNFYTPPICLLKLYNVATSNIDVSVFLNKNLH